MDACIPFSSVPSPSIESSLPPQGHQMSAAAIKSTNLNLPVIGIEEDNIYVQSKSTMQTYLLPSTPLAGTTNIAGFISETNLQASTHEAAKSFSKNAPHIKYAFTPLKKRNAKLCSDHESGHNDKRQAHHRKLQTWLSTTTLSPTILGSKP